MIRVGIQFAFFDDQWIGGVSAIANLVNAVRSLDDRRVEPVLVAGNRTSQSLIATMPGVPVLRTDLVDPSTLVSRVGRAARRGLGVNVPLDRWLRRNRIAVFSHGLPLGRRARTPTIGHIADFGYKHFPELYAPRAWARTDRGTARVCNEFDLLLLSSRAVEGDYRRFFPDGAARSAVLNILPSAIPDQASTAGELAQRYGIPSRYVFSPNQFWVHKNHATIIEALAIARSMGHDVHVVCTGLPHDPRRPNHFRSLIERAERLGVRDRFHVLGVVPYRDAMDLMRHSVAVLSASLFEGWGISVTEANLLGKMLILSDIAPFREQAPARARYFDPRNAGQLARELIASAEAYSESADEDAAAAQRRRWPEMVRAYGAAYEKIVLDVAGR